MPTQGPIRQYRRGTNLPLRESYTREYDPQRGLVYRYVYRNISPARMEALQGDYMRAGVSSTLQIQGDAATLEVSDSSADVTLDTWQIGGSEFQKSIWNHPTVLSWCGLNADLPAMLAALASSSDEKDPSKILNDHQLDLSAGQKAGLLPFMRLARSGSTDYAADAQGGGYVLRHTTNAPGNWGANVADWGVGMIYSTAQLLSEVSSSYYWYVPLPGRLRYKISNIPTPSFIPNNYYWGWRKSRSQESNAAGNRVDITTEYTLELWSTDLYRRY